MARLWPRPSGDTEPRLVLTKPNAPMSSRLSQAALVQRASRRVEATERRAPEGLDPKADAVLLLVFCIWASRRYPMHAARMRLDLPRCQFCSFSWMRLHSPPRKKSRRAWTLSRNCLPSFLPNDLYRERESAPTAPLSFGLCLVSYFLVRVFTRMYFLGLAQCASVCLLACTVTATAFVQCVVVCVVCVYYSSC